MKLHPYTTYVHTLTSKKIAFTTFGESVARDLADVTAKEIHSPTPNTTFEGTVDVSTSSQEGRLERGTLPQDHRLISSIHSIQTVQPEAPDWLLRGKHLKRNLVSSVHATQKVMSGQASNDYDLANTSDTMQRAATLGIATLGGLASGSKTAMLDFFVGTASWLGMMSALPIMVDWLVHARTGFNTAGRYMASYPVGDENRQAVKPIAMDPNYIPLVGIPKADLERMQTKVV
ncbi:MAG: hypothetical protein ACKO37_08005, partial [Vampirovibrionales bacterium]